MRLLAGFMAAACAGLVVWQWNTQRPTIVAHLSNGSQLRLVDFQVGSTFYEQPRRSLLQRFQDFIHARPPPQVRRGSIVYDHSVGWLSFRLHDSKTDADTVPNITDIVVFDEHSAARWMGDVTPPAAKGKRGERVVLHVYPRRAARFRLRCKVDGESVEMTIPNWGRVTAAPQWKASPLPQTQRVGGREYTLKSVGIEATPAADVPYQKWEGPHWFPHADLEFRDHGVVKETIGMEISYLDEAGNQSDDLLPASEAIWRLRVKFRPQSPWNYDASDTWLLGTLPAPKPGEYRELPIPPVVAERGVVKIALLGIGHYVCTDGAFTLAEASPGKPPKDDLSGTPGGHYFTEYSPKTPVLMVVRVGEKATDSFDIKVRCKTGERWLDLNSMSGRGSGYNKKSDAV